MRANLYALAIAILTASLAVPVVEATLVAAQTEPAQDGLATDGLRWALVATPRRLTMSQRARFRLRRQVTNEASAVRDATQASASFTLDGASSMSLDMAFGNGARSSQWAALAPGATVSDDRMMGEDLFPAPGDYVIAMTTDGVTVTTRVHVDP